MKHKFHRTSLLGTKAICIHDFYRSIALFDFLAFAIPYTGWFWPAVCREITAFSSLASLSYVYDFGYYATTTRARGVLLI